jgi:V-type H+-transporting ATPase proteolipid subunit
MHLEVLTWTTPALGAAYGTVKSGIGIASVAAFRPDLIIKVKLSPFMSLPHAIY